MEALNNFLSFLYNNWIGIITCLLLIIGIIKKTNFPGMGIKTASTIETPYKNKSAYANNTFSFFRK